MLVLMFFVYIETVARRTREFLDACVAFVTVVTLARKFMLRCLSKERSGHEFTLSHTVAAPISVISSNTAQVYGIYLTESGGGIYEENRIHNIRGSGIYVAADCSPVNCP